VIESEVGVPNDEYDVMMDVMAGAAKAPAEETPSAVPTAIRIVRETNLMRPSLAIKTQR
jgi:hypothetical protein